MLSGEIFGNVRFYPKSNDPVYEQPLGEAESFCDNISTIRVSPFLCLSHWAPTIVRLPVPDTFIVENHCFAATFNVFLTVFSRCNSPGMVSRLQLTQCE